MFLNKNPLTSLDIIIPSFRVNPEFILRIMRLKSPTDLSRKIILVIDNPNIEIPSELIEFEDDDFQILVNEENLGAGGSRNRGIESSTSEWLLFLDDDIIPEEDLLFTYFKKMQLYDGKSPGFVGITQFPSPDNSFTYGMENSGLLNFFTLPKRLDHVTWGATSNLLVNRNAVGNKRFGRHFPKAGGGEDIDFCFNISTDYEFNLTSASDAIVHHPWWNESKRSYRRSMRWGFSDTMLPSLYSKHSWRDIPNSIELLFLSTLILIPLAILGYVDLTEAIVPAISILLGEFIFEWLSSCLTRKSYNPLLSIETSIVKMTFAFGGLCYILSSARVGLFCKRFDYGYPDFSKERFRSNSFRFLMQVCITVIILYNSFQVWF